METMDWLKPVMLLEMIKMIHRNGPGIIRVWIREYIAQFCANYLLEVHHKYYIVHYPYGLSWYSIRVPRNRLPIVIEAILDQNDKDVRDHVLPIMGPGYNFHGITTTPGDLGYETLSFQILGQEELIPFPKDSPINIVGL